MRHLAKLSAAALGVFALAGCATLETAAVDAVTNTKYASLTGAQVVGGSGDPDASAKAKLSVSDTLDQICYEVYDVSRLDGTPTRATIGRAGPGSTGATVMNLNWANEGGFKNCVGRSEWLEDSLEKNPGAYYIAIYTTAHPNGAIRGNFYDK